MQMIAKTRYDESLKELKEFKRLPGPTRCFKNEDQVTDLPSLTTKAISLARSLQSPNSTGQAQHAQAAKTSHSHQRNQSRPRHIIRLEIDFVKRKQWIPIKVGNMMQTFFESNAWNRESCLKGTTKHYFL